ncbi:MAG: tetratricopeptide repeat protein [Actinobacteria bacterium]|nr:tetratricopeptide repeat protein [Actinomycetota bacterium]
MMMNRERIGFWVRLVAILLSVFFIGSFIFVGLGTNVSYNLFELIGGSDQQQGGQTTDPQEQIEQAERELEENPKDPEAIKELAALYYQNGQLEDAARVLENGREVAPKDAEIPLLLGEVYSRQAQVTPEEEQKKDLYRKAGDAYAAAAEIEPDNEDAYVLAGQAYDQADEPAQAIKYYNGYLDLEPEGEEARAVKERISALLEGGETTGSS